MPETPLTGPPLLALVGPTASGKHDVALVMAERLGAEIISLDSMKVYRGMDVGTAKPSPEERARIPHHLVDRLDPWESYSAARFVADAEAAIGEIRARGRSPLLAGGTILYLKALLHGLFEGPAADPALRRRLSERARIDGPGALHADLARVDPETAKRLHPHDLKRVIRALEVHDKTGQPISRLHGSFRAPPRHPCAIVALRRGREALYRRIAERVDRMIANGLADEVRRLLADPRGMSPEALQGHGYKELVPYVNGLTALGEAREAVIRHTKLYARKQMTWLRGFGAAVRWIPADEGDDPAALAGRALERINSA